VLVAFVVLRRISRRRQVKEGVSSYNMPKAITPFSVLDLLARISHDDSLKLTSEQRTELLQTIHGIEETFFARNGDKVPEQNLESIASRWLVAAEQ
jgi:hypothetical protein